MSVTVWRVKPSSLRFWTSAGLAGLYCEVAALPADQCQGCGALEIKNSIFSMLGVGTHAVVQMRVVWAPTMVAVQIFLNPVGVMLRKSMTASAVINLGVPHANEILASGQSLPAADCRRRCHRIEPPRSPRYHIQPQSRRYRFLYVQKLRRHCCRRHRRAFRLRHAAGQLPAAAGSVWRPELLPDGRQRVV